jgi:trans-aconitate methyltransferase
MMRSSGYDAVGVDPAAPDGKGYLRVEFEQLEPVRDADGVVASTSLHHVTDPTEVIDRIAMTLAGGGTFRLHAGETLLQLLDARLTREQLARGPYFFPDLAGTSEEDERAAIEAGQLRATRIDYVGSLR